jgi:hypothetical protein
VGPQCSELRINRILQPVGYRHGLMRRQRQHADEVQKPQFSAAEADNASCNPDGKADEAIGQDVLDFMGTTVERGSRAIRLTCPQWHAARPIDFASEQRPRRHIFWGQSYRSNAQRRSRAFLHFIKLAPTDMRQTVQFPPVTCFRGASATAGRT